MRSICLFVSRFLVFDGMGKYFYAIHRAVHSTMLVKQSCQSNRRISLHELPLRNKGGVQAARICGLAMVHVDPFPTRVAVVGGGAAGFFSAIHAALSAKDQCLDAEVTIYEAGKNTLSKVKISGGGRCNVLHDDTKPVNQIVEGYPRGRQELLGPLTKTFGPKRTAEWFREQGVALKIEPDGRMFPTSDSSQTVIDCLHQVAKRAGVNIKTLARIKNIELQGDTTFKLVFKDHNVVCDKLILATGSAREGHEWVRKFGHSIAPPVPSLFTFEVDKTCAKLQDLAGISVPDVQIKLLRKNAETLGGNETSKSKKASAFIQKGPVLITHSGLSGPAALKLSAFAARALHEDGYQGTLQVNWLGDDFPENKAFSQLEQFKLQLAKKSIITFCPFEAGIPRRLWHNLVLASEIAEGQKWAEISKNQMTLLSREISACKLPISGKATFKEEFVTCGGVTLKEIDMKSMQSKLVPGLHFCGEIIDVDGITGGYNFQNAWTTGFIAGISVL